MPTGSNLIAEVRISSQWPGTITDVALSKCVYMKGPAVYNFGEANCFCMLKCIHSLVQAPRQYHVFSRGVYEKAGLSNFKLMSVCSSVTSQTSLGNKGSPMKKFLLTASFSTRMWCLRKCAPTSRAVIRWLQ